MHLAIIIPLANEEQTVPELLGRVTDQLGPEDAVFCIVDNASKDDTRGAVEAFAEGESQRSEARDQIGRTTENEELSTLNITTSALRPPTSDLRPPTSDLPPPTSALRPAVHCVFAPENRCVVDAYFRGYREAYAAGAQWILEMDGGLSHLPEEIPRFIKAMESGVDFAAGSRFIEGSNYHESRFARWLTSRGGTWIANFLLGTRMKDMTSGFECFSRTAMERLLDHGVKSKAHFFQTEIRYLMHRLKWVEVPITYSCPSKSVGKNSLTDALKSLYALWREHVSVSRKS